MTILDHTHMYVCMYIYIYIYILVYLHIVDGHIAHLVYIMATWRSHNLCSLSQHPKHTPADRGGRGCDQVLLLNSASIFWLCSEAERASAIAAATRSLLEAGAVPSYGPSMGPWSIARSHIFICIYLQYYLYVFFYLIYIYIYVYIY